jgi:ATP-binding cassette subfamily B protein
MTSDVQSLIWPMDRVADALGALARAISPKIHDAAATVTPGEFAALDIQRQTQWLDDVAARHELTVEPVTATHEEVTAFVAGAGTALLVVDGEAGGLLLLRDRRHGKVGLIAPDRGRVSVPIEAIVAGLTARAISRAEHAVADVLAPVDMTPQRRARLHAAFARDQLATEPAARGWTIRAKPAVPAMGRAPGWLWTGLLTLVGTRTIASGLWLLSWWLLGTASLEGRLDPGWLAAWGLLLVTAVPLELFATSIQARLTINLGTWLKQHLLDGILGLEPDEVRRHGSGQFLGRVIEAQAVDGMVLTGGFLALTATLELIAAMVVLSAASMPLATALLAGMGIEAVLLRRFATAQAAWTRCRLAITKDLVQQVAGHRTRLVQQPREQWHVEEDVRLAEYLDASGAMDRAFIPVSAVAPRAWLLVAVGVIGLLFAAGVGRESLALALGGALLAYRALRRVAMGAPHVVSALTAWREAAPIRASALRRPVAGEARPPCAERAAPDAPTTVLEARDLEFRHSRRSEPTLRACDLAIPAGGRFLLEGPSASGKSTLVAMFSGLRVAQRGLVLLHGMDRETVGDRNWRRSVSVVPQVQENHVFTGTFAFNLLLGCSRPLTPDDVSRATHLCRELDLDGLIARMPAGLFQQVGETGWQLSHGERSRLFIARGLLQRPEVLIIDEGLSQLDPESYHKTVQCILRHAEAVIVVRHD